MSHHVRLSELQGYFGDLGKDAGDYLMKSCCDMTGISPPLAP